MGPIRLVIVDDHRMFVDGLRLVLALERDIEVVSAVTNGTAGVAACSVERPNVALVDVDLPDMEGVAAASAIVAGAPDTNVVVVSARSSPEVISRAIEAGAVGFVAQDRPAEELVRIVRSAASGNAGVWAAEEDGVTSLEQERAPHRAQSRPGLSGRELDVLQGLADGFSTAELARRLFVSPRTIQGHVQNILTKLEARSKLEAVLGGLRLGLVRLRSPRKRTG
jgi:DNA-binding NarL/FixJ family response regulator